MKYMSNNLSSCLPVQQPVFLSSSPTTCLHVFQSNNPSSCLPVQQPVFMSSSPTTCLLVFQSNNPSSCLPVQQPVFMSSCPTTCLLVFLSKQPVFLSRNGKKWELSARFLPKSLAVNRIFPTFVVAMRQSRWKSSLEVAIKQKQDILVDTDKQIVL